MKSLRKNKVTNFNSWSKQKHMRLRIHTQFNSNISLQFILESNSLYSWDGFYYSGLPMGYMTNRTNVYSRLPWYYFGRQRRQLSYILESKMCYYTIYHYRYTGSIHFLTSFYKERLCYRTTWNILTRT